MAGDRERAGDWTGDRWAPDDTTDEAAAARDTGGEAVPDATDEHTDVGSNRWNKTQWVGDQGEGAPAPVDPDSMPEGDNALTGDRHTSGEQHWAGDDTAGRAGATGDRPLDR
jgi:hypothetical protein